MIAKIAKPQIFPAINFEDDITTQSKKTIQIVAGPNGSGKSTFAESYLIQTKKDLVFLNPDIIAAGMGANDFEKASFHAGRILLSEIHSRLERGENFSFESTLSGKTWLRTIRRSIFKGSIE